MTIVNTNMASVNALRNLGAASTAMSKSLEKLSSGYRINRAADDAAGLAISEKMRGQIRGLNQAQRNAQDGISLLQTAEGAMNEVHSILQRMRELAVEGSSETLDTTNDLGAIKKEIDALALEITRIDGATKFNGTAVSGFSGDIQIGADTTDQLAVTIDQMDATTLGVNALDFTTSAGAQTAIGTIDAAITTLAGSRASIGAVQNRLEHSINNLAITAENMTAAESRIRDVDMAKAMSEFTKNQILNQAGVSVLAQANQTPQAVLKLLG